MNKAGRNGTWKKTSFSVKVKKKLIDKNMTIVDLSKEIGKSQSYLSQVLYGIKNDATCREKIEEVLGIRKNYQKVAGE